MDEDPAYDISVIRLDGQPVDDAGMLVDAVRATLLRHGVSAATITLALVDDGHIATLNERHLGHVGPTDVLTFDLRDSASVDRRNETAVEGEVVMSWETAAREAQDRGHATVAELALYAVHGTLHLLGYDDATEPESDRMHAVEDEVLLALGVGAVYQRSSR